MVQDVSYFSRSSVFGLPLIFREHQVSGGGKDPTVLDEEQLTDQDEKFLVCKVCRYHITTPSQQIVVDSTHCHTFFNPSGIVFDIGCFRNAPGCSLVGSPSGEFSWFAGTVWTLVVCSKCLTHLGWFFEGDGKRFFGLILNKLLEIESGEQL